MIEMAMIGGGIVGLSTADRFLTRFPGKRLVVLEKEPSLALHQTGRNSGVVHSGIYYKPGSQKALQCRAGKAELERFCIDEGIAYERCGKVIVAVDETELAPLQRIFERGQANGVECRLIPVDELRELEPHVNGVSAIHVPETGIVDYRGVCDRLGDRIRRAGGEIRLGAKVVGIQPRADSVVVRTTLGDVEVRQVVNCGGLYSDRLARLAGQDPTARIIPFRGEYFELRPQARRLCRNLIYPTPDPQFPFLGVHFTRMALGGIECGPNAVLAFAREGYHFFDISLRDLAETMSYRGFRRMALKHWRMGLGEMYRSLSKSAFVRALQRLIPEIRPADLLPSPSGIRAQALAPTGELVDDFLFVEADRVLNVCNAPSPAATASLAIGQSIVDRIAGRFS